MKFADLNELDVEIIERTYWLLGTLSHVLRGEFKQCKFGEKGTDESFCNKDDHWDAARDRGVKFYVSGCECKECLIDDIEGVQDWLSEQLDGEGDIIGINDNRYKVA